MHVTSLNNKQRQNKNRDKELENKSQELIELKKRLEELEKKEGKNSEESQLLDER